MKVIRLRLARDLISMCGLLDESACIVETPEPADPHNVLKFHSADYLDTLRQASDGHLAGSCAAYGIGQGDNPHFPGVYEFSMLSAGGSIRAARMVADGVADRVFHIAGGLHHAHRERASGFCYLNDPVLAILNLLDHGLRVAYVDVDAHHGDGVQWAFYDTDRVLTISMHQDGHTLFPGSGGVVETGRGEGEGYSVNIPLLPRTEDDLYLRAFTEVVVPLVQWYDPNIVVTQLGVDSLRDDPLAMLDLTPQGFDALIKIMREHFPRWVALGGGGYDLRAVACVWTRAWSVISGQACGDIEDKYPQIAARAGLDTAAFRKSRLASRVESDQAVRYGESVLQSVKEVVRSLLSLEL